MNTQLRQFTSMTLMTFILVFAGCDAGLAPQSTEQEARAESGSNPILPGIAHGVRATANLDEERTTDEPMEAPETPSPETATGACPSLGSDGLLFTYADRRQLQLVQKNGGTVTVDLPDDDIPENYKVKTQVHAKFSHILVVRHWESPLFGGPFGMQLTMVDHEGELLWHLSDSGVWVGSIQLGEDGTVVGRQSFYEPNAPHWYQLMAIDPDGTLHEFDDHDILGAPVQVSGDTPHMAVPVRRGSGDEQEVGWFNLDEGTFHKVFGGEDGSRVGVLDGYLFLLTHQHSPLLMMSTAGRTQLRMRWVPGLSFAKRKRIVQIQETGWVLFEDTVSGNLYRMRFTHYGDDLDPATDLELLNITPPEGFEAGVPCEFQKPAIDWQGRLLMPFRNGATVQAFRLEDETGEWSAIGEPMSNTLAPRLSSVGISYVINGRSTSQSCWGTSLETTSDTLDTIDGPSVQVTESYSGKTFIMADNTQPPTPSLHASGLCFAEVFYDPTHNWVEVVDILADTRTTLDIPSISAWIP